MSMYAFSGCAVRWSELVLDNVAIDGESAKRWNVPLAVVEVVEQLGLGVLRTAVPAIDARTVLSNGFIYLDSDICCVSGKWSRGGLRHSTSPVEGRLQSLAKKPVELCL